MKKAHKFLVEIFLTILTVNAAFWGYIGINLLADSKYFWVIVIPVIIIGLVVALFLTREPKKKQEDPLDLYKLYLRNMDWNECVSIAFRGGDDERTV